MKRILVEWLLFYLICDKCRALRNVTLEIDTMLRADDTELKEILFEMMRNFMDQNANPCEDFHQYACGNFHTYNYITDEQREKNMMELVMTYIMSALNTTINELPELFEKEPVIRPFDPRRKLWTYYQSCMDKDFNIRYGPTKLLKLIRFIEPGLAFDEEWEGPRSTFGVILGKLKRLNYETFIEANVYADYREPTKSILYLIEPKNSFISGEFNQCVNIEDLLPYKINNKVGQVVHYFTSHHNKLIELKDEIVDFEIEYRNIAKKTADRTPAYKQYQKLSIRMLQKEIPDFDWIGYLREFRGYDLDLEENVIVVDMQYFKNLAELLQRKTNTAISRIMIDFAKTYLDLFGVFNKGNMWETCVQQASTLMVETLSHLFAEHVGFEHHPELLSMVEDLRRNFGKLIKRATWIEPRNKPTLLQKLRKMNMKSMGLPKKILNPSVRRCKLHGVIMKHDFFTNTIKLQMNFVRQEMEAIGKPIDDEDMEEPPSGLFATNEYVKNKVSVGIGYLSPPFFHASYPSFYHFATLGYVISHEMAHAFDDVGMYFFGDRPNHQDSLYTCKSSQKYNKILECFRNEYNLAGISPLATLETLPDSIGVKIAYETYLEWKANNPEIVKNEGIPGLDLDDSQLFFLSFAMTMCSQKVDGGTKEDLTISHPYGKISSYNYNPDEQHPPPPIRLLGTLRLSEEFAETFNCPVNSKMNPESKCSVFD